VGTARTVGNLIPDFKPKRDGMAMRLIFAGTTTSRTVGRKRLAQIVGRTTTEFRVATPIVFDLKDGFSSGRPSVKATIIRSCQNVRTRNAGLLAPFVRAAARQNLRRQRCQIRREGEALTRRRMAAESDQRVGQHLEVWNKQWAVVRKLLLDQPWYREESLIQLASHEDHVVLEISDAAPQETGTSPSRAMPSIELPARKSSSLLDVIICDEEKKVAGASIIVKFVEQIIEQRRAVLSNPERVSFETQKGTGWVMLSVMKAKPSQPETADAD
jgi:hypothetical protein